MPHTPWVLLLLHGALLGTSTQAAMEVKLGRSVSLPCSQDTPDTQWSWKSRFPQCAGVNRGPLLVTAGGYLQQGARPYFLGRLSLSNGSLMLRTAVMSDSGVYTCSGQKGVVSSTDLRVGGGCFNNLSISFNGQNALSCKVCKAVDRKPAQESAFAWTVNGKPARKEALRGRLGARVTLDSSSKDSHGKWRCTSVDHYAWHTEYCYEPAESDYSSPADTEVDSDSKDGISRKRLLQALLVACVLLVLVVAAILFACFIKKSCGRREMKAGEELENITARVTASKNSGSP